MTTRIIALLLLVMCAVSCGGGGDEGRHAFLLTLSDLPDSDFVRGHYEGWAVINGNARSTGKFLVVGSGATAVVMDINRSRNYGTVLSAEFGPASTLLGQDFPRINDASHLFITVEPEGDHDGIPSCQVLLGGEILDGQAQLSTSGFLTADPDFPCAVEVGVGSYRVGLGDVAAATGSFSMGSPTDDVTNGTANDDAGAWFGDLGTGQSLLNLPVLPGGWRYEGWVVLDGVSYSTGPFQDPTSGDEDSQTAPQRGPDNPGPSMPGQDYVQDQVPAEPFDPPALNLVTSTNFFDGDFRCFLTVEPDPDNDTAPFQLEVLDKVIPVDGVNSSGIGTTNIELDANGALPTAMASTGVQTLTLNALGLVGPSGDGTDRLGHFQVWVVIDGADVSAGRILVNGTDVFSLDSGVIIGNTTSVTFPVAAIGNPTFPTTCYITLERQGDADTIPSSRVVVAGDVSPGTGMLTLDGGGTGLGIADFSSSSGTFRLDTPTDDDIDVTNDASGVLFRTFSTSDSDAASLVLPELPAGWTYEGWVQDRNSGAVYSTGRFRDAAAPDSDDMVSASRGTEPKSGFPSRDFVMGVPTVAISAAQPGSITFVCLTIEPHPDNSAAPYLDVLCANVPAGAVVGGVGQGPVVMTNVFLPTLAGSMVIDF